MIRFVSGFRVYDYLSCRLYPGLSWCGECDYSDVTSFLCYLTSVIFVFALTGRENAETRVKCYV